MFHQHVIWLPEELFARARKSTQPRAFLVVAEELLMGQAIVALLEEHGYAAYLARDPAEAGRLVALHPEIEVAIFDAYRPSLELWWLIDGLLQLRPQMKLLTAFEETASSWVEIPLDGELPRFWEISDLKRTLQLVYSGQCWDFPVNH